MTNVNDDSKTIKKFKSDLIQTMPFFPNTLEVKQELEAQTLPSVLFHYIHWVSRFIPDRKRKVICEPYLFFDTRYKKYEKDVYALLRKAKNGEDLSAHLSEKAKTKGYTTKANILKKNDQWIDKDQILNTKGFFHLHLKSGKQNKGDIILLARVTREEFKAIALFDHDVFTSVKNGVLSKERKRMLAIHKDMIEREIGSNKVYMSNPITMSGHPIHIHFMCNEYWHVIQEIDHKLSDITFIKTEIFGQSGFEMPNKPKLRWCINGLDLGLYESKTSTFFVLRYGYL